MFSSSAINITIIYILSIRDGIGWHFFLTEPNLTDIAFNRTESNRPKFQKSSIEPTVTDKICNLTDLDRPNFCKVGSQTDFGYGRLTRLG